jgi:3-oxoacyl-[acyl-carrier-protein] synthase II
VTGGRVVLTGFGLVSPLGHSLTALWSGLCLARFPGAPLRETSSPRPPLICEVAEFDPLDYLHMESALIRSRAGHLVTAAGLMAVRDAQGPTSASSRMGIALGHVWPASGLVSGRSQVGGLGWERDLTTDLAEVLMATGPTSVCAQGSAAGLSAMAQAVDWIRTGQVEMAVAGGVDVPWLSSILPDCEAAGWVVRTNESSTEWVGPFDPRSPGMVVGEAAACVVLETEAHARARGASWYAEWEGYAGGAITPTLDESDEGPLARGMRRCRERQPESHQRIDHVWLTGIGLPEMDQQECRATSIIWNEEAKGKPCVTSLGGHVGHVFGATGPLQVIAACAALSEGSLPVVRNAMRCIPLWEHEAVAQEPPTGGSRAMILTTGIGGLFGVAVVARGAGTKRVCDAAWPEDAGVSTA